jgi:hypothetical protein
MPREATMRTRTGRRRLAFLGAVLTLTAVMVPAPAVFAETGDVSPDAQVSPDGQVSAAAEVAAVSDAPIMLAHHPIQQPHPLVAPGEEKAYNTGRLSLNFGADWVSAYYFRGVVFQEAGGDNVQPYLELDARLLEDTGPLTSLTLAGGVWNSFHSGGGTFTEPTDTKFWFEANLYTRLSATWLDVFTTSVSCTYYNSPNNSFKSKADVGLNLALDDTKWLGAFALHPSVLFAFQTQDHFLPEASRDGIYMGLSFAPGYTFFKGSAYPVTVSTPMTFGFSVRDYYTFQGKNQTFGYFQGGPEVNIPLTFMPADYGKWAFKAGVQFLDMNSNLRQANGRSDSVTSIGHVGFAMTY